MSNNSDCKTLVRHLETKALADACVNSANRSRFVIIIIIFASVLAFMGFWNSRPESYIHGRMLAARYAYKHKVYELVKMDSPSKDRLTQIWALNNLGLFSVDSVGIDSMPALVLSKRHSLYEYGLSQAKLKYNTDIRAKLQLSKTTKAPTLDSRKVDSVSTEIVLQSLSKSFKNERELFNRAIDLCKVRMLNKADRLQQFIEYLERLHVERVLTFQVPIFGIMVDVNDIGFFAGLTFIIVLLWFRYCLQKEYTNLKLVFETTKDDNREFTQWYNYLAMHQVLTVPMTIAYPEGGSVPPDRAITRLPSLILKKLNIGPQRSFNYLKAKPCRRLWSFIRILFFCLPFIVQACIISTDLRTLGIGIIAASQFFVNLMFWIGVVFLLAIGILTILCLVLTWDVDQEWRDGFGQLGKEEQKKEDNTEGGH